MTTTLMTQINEISSPEEFVELCRSIESGTTKPTYKEIHALDNKGIEIARELDLAGKMPKPICRPLSEAINNQSQNGE
jgi:hypothetical protein